ncbi:hypothetical protein BZA77DRAFT_81503 [Pyronema omphalodes]|nr:hypothetical protein BZA77DRAFT_81503 [Pyronema omphalodes]
MTGCPSPSPSAQPTSTPTRVLVFAVLFRFDSHFLALRCPLRSFGLRSAVCGLRSRPQSWITVAPGITTPRLCVCVCMVCVCLWCVCVCRLCVRHHRCSSFHYRHYRNASQLARSLSQAFLFDLAICSAGTRPYPLRAWCHNFAQLSYVRELEWVGRGLAGCIPRVRRLHADQ